MEGVSHPLSSAGGGSAWLPARVSYSLSDTDEISILRRQGKVDSIIDLRKLMKNNVLVPQEPQGFCRWTVAMLSCPLLLYVAGVSFLGECEFLN